MKPKPQPPPADPLRELAKLALARKDSVHVKRAAEKLAAGQPISKREEAALRAAAEGHDLGGDLAGYAGTWEDLAAQLSVDRKTLEHFRDRHARVIHERDALLNRPDGRHNVAEWRRLADEYGELRGRGLNNPDIDHIDERELRLRERRFAVENAEHKLKVQKGEVLPLTEYQSALRVTVGAFDAALKQIPGRAADKLVERARQAFIAMLRAALTEKQFAKIAPVLESAPVDHAGIVKILDTELEACRRALAEADFMQPDPELS